METRYDRKTPFPQRLAEGLAVLGNYYFNLYLVQGEQASALIEVGVSGVVDLVIGQLDALGVKPTFLVVTHPHSDHTTGLAALRERFPGALVVTAEAAEEFIKHPKAATALVEEDAHMTAFLETHGMIPGRTSVTEPPSLANSLIAREGDKMDLGGLTLHFLEVSGHSPGQLVVHVPEIDCLIASDSVGFRFPGRDVFPIFLTNYADYVATLDRLEGLKPSILGIAHQGPVLGEDAVRQAFQEARQRSVELRSRIVNDPRPAEELAPEVFAEFYKDELTMYTEENIMTCTRLIIRRARE
ncbi:MAG: MBL fold metallo-hydrolase [Desulfomonile tiedjei]|nr:MBL fold metallo-hydrolase [Desulfomonile tiedjei]